MLIIPPFITFEHDLSLYQAAKEVILPEEGTLWFSGKEMLRGKLLADYVGRNEKTKIVVKLNKRGTGAPAREPVVNEEQQKAMMSYYYRKQEEWKKLEANDEDSYLDSAWAERGQLKRQFHGLNNIKWGPAMILALLPCSHFHLYSITLLALYIS